MENNKTAKNQFDMQKKVPAAPEVEMAVLSAIITESKVMNQVMEILKPEHFYIEKHKIIFQSMVDLFTKSEPIDLLTLSNSLQNKGKLKDIGGAYFLTQIASTVASAYHVEAHSFIVKEKFMQRAVIQTFSYSIDAAFQQEDIFEVLDKAQTTINKITQDTIKNKEKNTTKIFTEFSNHIERISKSGQEISGVPTTIQELNSVTHGWQNSDLVIIAGRPASGKTAFTKACIKGAINGKQKAVLVFSLEMSAMQMAARLISEDTGVSTDSYLAGDYTKYTDQNRINSAIADYYDSNKNDLLIIDDSAGLTINELRARTKRICSEHDVCLVVIDYLQLIHGNTKSRSGNREQEISEVARGLKELAKDIDKPIVALAQLSRAVEAQGGNMKPKLSHLRESGEIEQAADIVCMLYRPEYYANQGYATLKEIEVNGRMISSKGYAELIVEKHRNGALKTVPMKFTDYLTKFSDWNDSDSYNVEEVSDEPF